jgi:peptide deformylase
MEILQHTEQVLNQPTNEVTDEIDHKILLEMKQVMDKVRGLGLAANQAGINKRFFIAMFPCIGYQVCINPKILRHGKELVESQEGCLSILGEDGKPIYKPKKRWAVIDVEYKDSAGRTVKQTLKRLSAKIFQHEIDHLNGKLCIDI